MNAVLFNLIFAFVWLFAGGFMLYAEWARQEPMQFTTRFGLNPGWLALLFGVFNLFRAWLNWRRIQRRRQDSTEDAAAMREQRQHLHGDRPQQPPDSNFQFTDEPKP